MRRSLAEFGRMRTERIISAIRMLAPWMACEDRMLYERAAYTLSQVLLEADMSFLTEGEVDRLVAERLIEEYGVRVAA